MSSRKHGGGLCTWILSLLVVNISSVVCLEVTLYDTTKLDSLGWTSYSPGLGSDRLGWREASFSNADGSVSRVYYVCNIDNFVAVNWVRLPFLRRGEAARLYVNARFTMRRCSQYPDPGSVQLCKESFKLMYYESDDDFANASYPSWDDNTYRSVDVVAADRLFTDIDNATINDVTRGVAVSRNGIHLAFYDQGACMTLLSVRVFYVVCPGTTSNLTVFNQTVTGPDLTSVVQTGASCTDRATSETPVYALCKADGKWMDLISVACQCLPGYQPDDPLKNCTECPLQTYKSWVGNGRCLPCPSNSGTLKPGSTGCQCLEGFQRRPIDGLNASCTDSIGHVRNLSASYINQTFVSLSWQPPGDKSVYYSVECSSCDSSVSYIPQQFGFSTTSVGINGLKPGKSYLVKVYTTRIGSAIDNVDDGSTASITVTTESLSSGVPKIASVYVVRIEDDSVDLVWTLMTSDATVAMETITGYEVSYWATNSNSTRSVTTAYPNVSVSPLLPDTRYIFQVRARSAVTWGEFSSSVSAKTELSATVPSATYVPLKSELPNLIPVIAGTAVGVIACIVIIAFVAILLIYRHKKRSSEGNSSDCDMLKYINGAHSLGKVAVNQSISSIPSTGTDSVHIYSDPYTYEDPNHFSRDRVCEIEPSAITIESILLKGCYGNICAGKMTVTGTTEVLIMIETLNENTSENERMRFLSKAEVIWRLNHPNVIAIKGVISKTTPHMIITEFMSNGSLNYFVKENGFRLLLNQLLNMLHGIASAMAHIAENRYILRDLTAKSILVDESLTCKVSSFDKLYYLEEDRVQFGKIEDQLLRSSPPEVLLHNCFSGASDVWSFGVVVWEVMSCGDSPYSGLSDDQVVRAVVSGNRLPSPQNCPDVILQLMANCWMQNPDQRPKFAAIVRNLETSVQTLGSLRTAKQPTRPKILTSSLLPSSVTKAHRRDDTDLAQWLQSMQLAFYLPYFESRGYSEVSHVVHLTDLDLERIGVTLPSHRKTLLQAIQDFKTNSPYMGTNDYYV